MIVYTSTYRYSGNGRLDITVKGQDSFGKVFAPTWDMVMGIKKQTISEAHYKVMYENILSKVPQHFWDELFKQDIVVLVCFCTAFCHRHILAKTLESLGANYGGEIGA